MPTQVTKRLKRPKFVADSGADPTCKVRRDPCSYFRGLVGPRGQPGSASCTSPFLRSCSKLVFFADPLGLPFDGLYQPRELPLILQWLDLS